MVINAGDPKLKTGDAASLLSPVYTNSQREDYCVAFWFYMDGADMGTLNVYVNADNAAFKNVFTAKGLCYLGIHTEKSK